jgi:hypothetical protein
LFVFAGSVDPAKLKRVPLVSSPSASAPQIAADSNGRHWLDGVKHDPRYQSIERKWQDQKDIALLFNAGPNPASVKQYEEELRDFYAAWAVEHGHATHYLELRKSSEALQRAFDRIEVDKKTKLDAERTRWEKDWFKALAHPDNREGLAATMPDVVGKEARRSLRVHLLRVAVIEEQAQQSFIEAGHYIITLGKTDWTPSQFSTRK